MLGTLQNLPYWTGQQINQTCIYFCMWFCWTTNDGDQWPFLMCVIDYMWLHRMHTCQGWYGLWCTSYCYALFRYRLLQQFIYACRLHLYKYTLNEWFFMNCINKHFPLLSHSNNQLMLCDLIERENENIDCIIREYDMIIMKTQHKKFFFY